MYLIDKKSNKIKNLSKKIFSKFGFKEIQPPAIRSLLTSEYYSQSTAIQSLLTYIKEKNIM